MKAVEGRFQNAFRRLKHYIDMQKLTTFERDDILTEMNEMRQSFEMLLLEVKKDK